MQSDAGRCTDDQCRFYRCLDAFRKGNTELEPIFYRPKQQPSPIPARTHIIFLRDSPLPYNDSYSNCRTPGSPPSSCNVAKLSSLITPEDPQLIRDEQIAFDSHPSEQQVSSSSSLDISSSMVASKLSITIPLNYAEEEDEADSEEKPLQEKSLLLSSRSSSHFKSESQLIDEVAGAQQKIQPVTAKVYEFTVPPTKKKTKKVSSKQRKRSKSIEKKDNNANAALKGNHHVLINTYSSIKSSTSSKKSKSTTKTTPPSKYSEEKWEEPYVGVRYDPPTPPCSPSVLLWSQDDERDENDTPLEKSQLFPSETKDNDLHSCIF